MNRINLKIDNAELLSTTIAQIVNFCSKKNGIECIYMNFENSQGNKSGQEIRLNIVTNSDYNNHITKYFDPKYDQRRDLRWSDRLSAEIKRRTGITIGLFFWPSDDYHHGMLHRREAQACNELGRSAILYDASRFGKTRTDKSQCREYLAIQAHVRKWSQIDIDREKADDALVEVYEPPLIPIVKRKCRKIPVSEPNKN